MYVKFSDDKMTYLKSLYWSEADLHIIKVVHTHFGSGTLYQLLSNWGNYDLDDIDQISRSDGKK